MLGFEPKDIMQFVEHYDNEQACIDHLELLRWGGDVISPFDPESKVYKCKGNKYHCHNTKKYFNVKTNTLFHGSNISLGKWFWAIKVLTDNPKTSSVELGRILSVTQRTSWKMKKNIKDCLGLDYSK